MWQSCAPENQVDIQLGHIRLAARLWGAKDKPLLLALHGWLDNANSFEPLASVLVDYQVLAIDWPGHGYSDHRPGKYPLHWIDYLFDLDSVIERLNLTQAPIAIMGHSLGGIVASAYCAAFPDKVERLILIEAIAPLFEDSQHNKARLVRSFASHQQQLIKDRPLSRYDSIEPAVRARMKLTGMAEPWCRLLVERNMKVVEGGVVWRSDPRLKLDSPARLSFEQVDHLMTGISMPTLLITGHDGFSHLQQALPQATQWFQSLTVVNLTGDHHLHMGNAHEVAQAIETFLAQR